MAVQLPPLPLLPPIAGIRLSTAVAGIKTQRADLVLMELAAGSQCAAVLTRNAFCAAPVTVVRQHLTTHQPRYLLINSGNANAGTGPAGYDDALTCCQTVAQLSGCQPQEVLPFSTGVIGQPLPTAKIQAALPTALAHLSPEGWAAAAQAIMTTDTGPKGFAVQEAEFTITGIAKGAGMIRPDMATLLAFLATDIALSAPLLHQCLTQAVDASFNRITVDGDTSTNDACVLIATGQRKLPLIDSVHHPLFAIVQSAVTQVCTQLAQTIVRDGEGATKLITISVEQGRSEAECVQVAYTVAHSPLVKTAFFASDANWGRILAAVGRCALPEFTLETVDIFLNEVCIVAHGGIAATYREAQGQQVMQQAEITIRILLGRGEHQAHILTCDLSYDYVRINAEYRT